MVFFLSSADPLGSNPDHRWQLFRWAPAADTIVQLSSFGSGLELTTGFFGELALDAPSVSSDGESLLVVSRADPLGSNPDRSAELFLVDASDLTWQQLTFASDAEAVVMGRFALAGAGGHFAFSSNYDHVSDVSTGESVPNVFFGDIQSTSQTLLGQGAWPTIDESGTAVAFQGSASIEIREPNGALISAVPGVASYPQLSGDGATLAYLRFGNGFRYSVDTGSVSGFSFAGRTRFFGLADDGQRLFYTDPQFDVLKYQVPSTQQLFPGPGWSEADCTSVATSGDGSKVAFRCSGVDPLGSNPDGGVELFYSLHDGAHLAQWHSSEPFGESTDPTLADSTGDVVFVSSANLLDESNPPGVELYRYVAQDGSVTRLTTTPGSTPTLPRLSDDGQFVVFSLNEALGSSVQLLNLPTMALTEIASESSGADCPTINGDGSVIVARRGSEFVRLATDGSGSSLVATQVFTCPEVDQSGEWVLGVGGGGLRLIALDGSSDLVVAPFAGNPKISGDASRILYSGVADPVGQNQDGNQELFLYDVGTQATQQITDTFDPQQDLNNFPGDLSHDGRWVYLTRTRRDRFATAERFRLDTQTLQEHRIDGPRPCKGQDNHALDADASGARVVFAGARDCTGMNPDGNFEIVLIDQELVSLIRAEETSSGTILTWPAPSGPYRYDVIRGSLGSLGIGVSGETQLGAVDCIADDLILPSSAETPDSEIPTAGSGFFYLMRGEPNGDFGSSSQGKARTASGAPCGSN